MDRSLRLAATLVAAAVGIHLLMLVSHGPHPDAGPTSSPVHAITAASDDEVGGDDAGGREAAGAAALAAGCLVVLAAGLFVAGSRSSLRVVRLPRPWRRRPAVVPSDGFRVSRAPPTPVSEGVLLRT